LSVPFDLLLACPAPRGRVTAATAVQYQHPMSENQHCLPGPGDTSTFFFAVSGMHGHGKVLITSILSTWTQNNVAHQDCHPHLEKMSGLEIDLCSTAECSISYSCDPLHEASCPVPTVPMRDSNLLSVHYPIHKPSAFCLLPSTPTDLRRRGRGQHTGNTPDQAQALALLFLACQLRIE